MRDTRSLDLWTVLSADDVDGIWPFAKLQARRKLNKNLMKTNLGMAGRFGAMQIFQGTQAEFLYARSSADVNKTERPALGWPLKVGRKHSASNAQRPHPVKQYPSS
jgi:hypothetical protein